MTLTKEKIEAVLAQSVSPLLEVDGASLEIVEVDEKNKCLQIRFGGRYRGAPCRETVTRFVIEPVLKKEFPGIETVEWLD